MKCHYEFFRRAGLILAAMAGVLLSACNGAGDDAAGVVQTNGALTTLHAFAVTDGFQPTKLVRDANGNLYGVTAGNSGSVFEITAAGTFTQLHVFSNSDGNGPSPDLVFGSDGTLYGTTFSGGTYNAGTVYKITSDGAFSTVYVFTGTDGAFPRALLLGADGNLYGVTSVGGPGFSSLSDASLEGCGTVYRLTPNGSLTTLYAFGGPDGYSPNGLLQGADGNFYGITAGGGPTYQNNTQFGAGTVFELTPAGILTSLYAFDDVTSRQPTALVAGSDGTLYGTADTADQNGMVFAVTPSGAFSIIHHFDGTDGQGPDTLIAGPNGSFYGATVQGGAGYKAGSMDLGSGTVFQMAPNGDVTTLFSFNADDGATPQSLVLASSGALYGVTSQGGIYARQAGAGGTVFELSLAVP